jgi:restriction system protein
MAEIFFGVILSALLIIISIKAAPIVKKIAYHHRIKRSGIDDITDGHDFEIYITHLLKGNGFNNIRTTTKSGDYGADIIAELNGVKYAIQCKLYNRTVGIKAVQGAYSAMQYYGCQAAAVATNNRFSKNAVNLAVSTGVYLWDRDAIVDFFLYNR